MGISQLDYQNMERRLAAGRRDRAKIAGMEALERLPCEAVADEGKLHGQILVECEKRGWIALHGSMAHRSRRTVGEPDFTILASGGRTLFVECKTKTGKLTPEQLGMKMWAEKLGHVIYTVRSMGDFLAVLVDLGIK